LTALMTAPSHYARRRSGLTNTRAGHGTGSFRQTPCGTSATRASLAAIRDDPDAFQGANQGANQG
jgi:hypothetical protein